MTYHLYLYAKSGEDPIYEIENIEEFGFHVFRDEGFCSHLSVQGLTDGQVATTGGKHLADTHDFADWFNGRTA